MHVGLCLSRFCCACQLLFEGLSCQETISPEQEHRSFGRRHFLEYGIQNKTYVDRIIMCIILIKYIIQTICIMPIIMASCRSLSLPLLIKPLYIELKRVLCRDFFQLNPAQTLEMMSIIVLLMRITV